METQTFCPKTGCYHFPTMPYVRPGFRSDFHQELLRAYPEHLYTLLAYVLNLSGLLDTFHSANYQKSYEFSSKHLHKSAVTLCGGQNVCFTLWPNYSHLNHCIF